MQPGAAGHTSSGRASAANIAYLHLAQRELVGVQENLRAVKELRRELFDV